MKEEHAGRLLELNGQDSWYFYRPCRDWERQETPYGVTAMGAPADTSYYVPGYADLDTRMAITRAARTKNHQPDATEIIQADPSGCHS